MKLKNWDKNLKIRLAGEGIINLLFWTFFPFMTIYFRDYFGEGKASLFLIISQTFSVVGNLIGGYSADRFGRKKMMVLSTVAQSASFLLFAFANSPWYNSPLLTFIAFSLLGVCGSIYWPASHAMVADVVAEKDRASVFAVFYTAINIAVVVGPIVGGFVFYSHRFEMLLTGFVLTTVLSIVLQKYLRETTTPRMRKQEKKKVWYHVIWDELSDYRLIVKDKTFLLFVVAGVLVAQTFMQLDILLAVYINDVVDHQTLIKIGTWQLSIDGKRAFAIVLAENGLLVALLTVAITRISNQFKEKRIFILSSLFYAIAITLYGLSHNVWVFLILMGFFTLAELLVVGIQESFISKLAPENMRGQYFSAASLRFTLGRMLAPLSLTISSLVGYQNTFFILGGLALVSALTYAWMFNRFDHEKVKQATI